MQRSIILNLYTKKDSEEHRNPFMVTLPGIEPGLPG